MEEESERLHFETAARIRDQIEHIEKVIEKQKIVSRDFLDQDVIGFHRRDHTLAVHPLFVRAGMLLGGKGFTFPSSGLPDEELLFSFLHQYYREGKFIPEQILLPMGVPEQGLLERSLSERRGKKVQILVPVRGDRKHLLEMACENAEKFLRAEADIEKDEAKLLEAMRERLHLRNIPRKIEAFDISNFQGRDAVGSMVSFEDGKPDKDRYRHFKIKTIEGADDYGMMYEVLLRRYQKASEETAPPDLVLLDGGRGQLNVAVEVFKELSLKGIDLLGLAKGRMVKGLPSSHLGKTGEKIFHPHYKEPLKLERNAPILHFLDRIRDEAHRFAITYHKKVRKRRTFKTALGEIPGIGKVRQRELLRYFGSVEKIKEASMEELNQAPRMNSKSAQTVYDYFHPDQNS
jgi:excinuclease ABC subunit C